MAQGHRLVHLHLDSVASQIAVDLLQFMHRFPWDAQRREGEFFDDWVDYATIAIGLYAAAAGISKHHILMAQNIFAGWFSNFGRVPMDSTYTNVPKRNISNTEISFRLYRDGQFDLVPQHDRAR